MKMDSIKTKSERMGEKSTVSRRTFIGQIVAGVGISGLIAACGGEQTDSAQSANGQAGACSDYSGLTEQDLQVRESLDYVDVSPNPNEVCSNCQFYNQPEAGSVCGGCQLFAGPVSPGGYCISWALRAA
jgi:hypothetical protein